MRLGSRAVIRIVTALLSLLVTCGPIAFSMGAEIRDQQLGYVLKLPEGFIEDPRLLQGAHPDVVRAFARGTLGDTPNFLAILVKRMHGTIGREPIKRSDLPAGFTGSLFKTTWQGFQVDAFELPESANGNSFVTFNVQIPLKREAIQISVFGPLARKEEIRGLVDSVLSGLSGESNWIPSAVVAPSVESSPHYGTVLIVITAVAIVAGLAGLWFISRRSPKGTVLAVALIAYFMGVAIALTRTRETLLVGGILKMVGFIGAILGIVDLIRKRKPREA